MSDTIDVRVPDIGDFAEVPVIEVLIKPGDTVKKNDSLVTLESDKASMEVPSDVEGTVQSVAVKIGDKVSKGTLVATLAPAGGAVPAATPPAATTTVAPSPAPAAAASGTVTPSSSRGEQTIALTVPDIGDFKDVPVIEVLVKPGDTIAKDAALVVLESEKASMEVPASTAGTIAEIKVKPGDKVSQGTVIATIAAPLDKLGVTMEESSRTATTGDSSHGATTSESTRSAGTGESTVTPSLSRGAAPTNGVPVHASPAIRRFARELGVDLRALKGSGPHGRVTREDVQGYVKTALADGGGALRQAQGDNVAFAGLPAWPKVDFAQFGEIERKPLSRIKKLSGPNLHRNWLQIPHITNYDEADITELEAFRNEINAEQTKRGGAKLTMLAFLIKASVAALAKFPEFNTSLDGAELVYKRYFNIGFAADTPNGLVVPVLKNADAKGLLAIAAETAELAAKARDGKLGLGDMQGGTFTISSIGGIGGTAFTQIVNAPEVAILGAVRSSTKPVWDGKTFVPRLMLPISVSYDHRVIDGAGAARFLTYFASLLADFKRVSL